MPRSVPGGIAALVGQENTRAPIFLVKWELGSGTRYYSSGEQVTWGGNTYERNRVKSIPTFEAGIIDRKNRNFSSLEILFDNLADDGSSNFPFTTLDAGEIFEDRKITVYAYSPDAADAVSVWWGYSKRPTFHGGDKTVTVSASFFWDALDLNIPAKLLPQMGFGPSESSSKTSDDGEEEVCIPLVYGAGSIGVRPVIYNKWTDGAYFHVNFIVSGTHAGKPFAAGDLQAADVYLFNTQAATVLEWYTGDQAAAPANLTRFPDNAAHTLVAFGYAAFAITAEIKDKKLDDINSGVFKIHLANGRVLVDTSLPSENPALILKDFLRDPTYSVGLPNALFDAAALATTSAYVGTRYQARYEFRLQKSVTERVQYLLSAFHGHLTFENGLIQINCKRNNEASVATFVTVDSGVAGRKIIGDHIPVVKEKDSSEQVNKFIRKFRKKHRPRRLVIVQDTTAQTRAGGTQPKPVTEEINEWDEGGLYDEEQNKINAAIAVREDQSGNLFCTVDVEFWDGIGIAPGDIITVRCVDVFNNASNRDFRVIKQTIDGDSEGNFQIGFEGQIYKPAIYNDDYLGLGVDLLRGGEDTSAIGRPPDVTPVSLAVIDVVTDDVEGKQATLRATFTVPAFDPTAEQADGIFREPPIQEVEIWWRYTDEPVAATRRGNTLKVYQSSSGFNASIDFQVDYRKTKSVEGFFVTLGPNRARSPLGYIPDTTKTTYLTSPLSATGITASVAATGSFAVNDYVQIEREFLQVSAKTSNSLTFVNDGSNRSPQFGSVSIAHPSGTEIAVAKKSYPSLTVALGRRFTYPIVTGLVAIQTEDGIRFRWADPSADNIETFLLYWSVDADALTNVNKLGSATPAWYLSDPYSPPAGVNVSLNDDRAHKVTQSEAGGAGVIVYARVAASNRRNFSSQLSASANSSSTGTGAAPTANPSSPGPGRMIENVIHYTSEESLARVTVEFDADATDNTKTFAQVGAINAVAVFRRTGDANTEPVKVGGPIADPSQTKIRLTALLPFGESWDWDNNILSNGVGKAKSTGAAYTFTTGGVIKVKPGDAQTVPSPTFGAITRNESNNKEDLVPINVAQNGSVTILFTTLWIEKSINGGAWNFEEAIDLRHEKDLYTGVSASKTFNVTIKRKAGVTAAFRALVRARGGKESATTTSATQGATSDDQTGDSAVPGNLQPSTMKYKSGALRMGIPVKDFTNAKTLRYIQGVIYCPETNQVLSPTTYAAVAAASEASNRFDCGINGQFVLNIKVEDLVSAFGSANSILYYYYAFNDVGGATSTTPHPTLTLASLERHVANTPGALAFPSAPSGSNNTVDGDPEKANARISLTLATASGTFSANNIAEIDVVMIRRNEANSADVGAPLTETRALKASELSSSSVSHEFFLRMGNRFRIIAVIARNGDAKTETTGTSDFVAGSVRTVDTTDSKTVPAPTFGTIARVDGSNKLDRVPISLAQDGVDIILFKRILVEVSINGGAWDVEDELPLKAIDELYTSVSASITYNLSIKRKSGVSAQFRATAEAVGGKVSSTTTSSSQSATTNDLLTDTAAPTLGTIGGSNAPLVEEYFGKFIVSCPTPSANINTLDGFQVIASTSSSAPAGDPTVGSEGVVRIKYGQSTGFKRKLSENVTIYFYYRPHNQANGTGTYGSWSTGTSVTGSAISRPLEDFIGTAVPTAPATAARSNTAQSSGATTSGIKLDTGASAVNDFYKGMTIYLPNVTAADRIRRILSYNGSTKFATFDTNVASSYNSESFEIYEGNIGYTNYDQNTVVTSAGARGVPFRAYLDTDSTEDKSLAEIIFPTGENAFSITEYEIEITGKNDGVVRYREIVAKAGNPVYRFVAESSGRSIRVRFRNGYRGGGSDGWSGWSNYGRAAKSTDGSTESYSPSTYTPVVVDLEALSNYPTSRYNAY